MNRLPVPAGRIGTAGRVELTREERHYLCDVLRLPDGAALEVFDGVGGRYPAILVAGTVLELGARVAEPPPARPLVLAQALVKGDKMELVIQKATELGVQAIAPFAAARSVVRLEGDRASERVQRWQRIADEAARQSGRADVHRVLPIVPFPKLLERSVAEGVRPLVLFERERSRRLSEALAANPGPAHLVIGPEGGFADEEIAAADQAGSETVTLGRLVLRTETAGLAALCVARFLAGELG